MKLCYQTELATRPELLKRDFEELKSQYVELQAELYLFIGQEVPNSEDIKIPETKEELVRGVQESQKVLIASRGMQETLNEIIKKFLTGNRK
jgi:hypothetical protein